MFVWRYSLLSKKIFRIQGGVTLLWQLPLLEQILVKVKGRIRCSSTTFTYNACKVFKSYLHVLWTSWVFWHMKSNCYIFEYRNFKGLEGNCRSKKSSVKSSKKKNQGWKQSWDTKCILRHLMFPSVFLAFVYWQVSNLLFKNWNFKGDLEMLFSCINKCEGIWPFSQNTWH